MIRDLALVLGLVGLFLAPVLPARAGISICTADGRKDAPEAPKGCVHILCERSRREG
jgi:hypothetical protein